MGVPQKEDEWMERSERKNSTASSNTHRSLPSVKVHVQSMVQPTSAATNKQQANMIDTLPAACHTGRATK